MSARDRNPSLCFSTLLGATLLSLGSACSPGVTLGQYGDTDGGSGTQGDAETGSSGEAQCDGDCDPDFAVVMVQGVNAETDRLERLATMLCEDASCPAALPEGVALSPCTQTEAALASTLGPEEYCRFAAQGLVDALRFEFSSPLARDSFERVRADPLDEATEEPYAWFTDVVQIEGPGTAFRGRHAGGGRFESVFNEACAERLTALGTAWTAAGLEAACVGTWDDGGVTRPLRMRPQMTFHPTEGLLSTTSGASCSSPASGPDTCCSACDRALGPLVARYGVDASGQRRSSASKTAIPCSLGADPLLACRDLALEATREDGASFVYAWDGAAQAWPLPLPDKLRETHPDDRPAGLVPSGVACEDDLGCPSGQACYGSLPSGASCSQGEDCTARTCQPAWFGACEQVAGDSTCVDRRFDDRGAGACFASAEDPSWRLSSCDANEDGTLASSECCIDSLGGAAGCDPFDQSGIVATDHYDREPVLSSVATCTCEAGEEGSCADAIASWCAPPIGAATELGPASAAGGYAVPLVERLGGVRLGDTSNALELRIANVGDLGRALTESCAEDRGRVEPRSAADGWTLNAHILGELREDHELAMCSGSSYTVSFTTSASPHHVRSEAGGTLDGRATFVIETAQFRLDPRSLFPTDNLRIASCATFSLWLTNAPDIGPANLRKLALHEGSPDGPRVAGGTDCSPDASPQEVAAGTIPCLDVGYEGGGISGIRFGVDEAVHGQVLVPGTTYAVVVPGLEDISQMDDPDLYAGAFHDACGMPLVETPLVDGGLDMRFTIDEACE